LSYPIEVKEPFMPFTNKTRASSIRYPQFPGEYPSYAEVFKELLVPFTKLIERIVTWKYGIARVSRRNYLCSNYGAKGMDLAITYLHPYKGPLTYILERMWWGIPIP